jgi:hypothetical protein
VTLLGICDTLALGTATIAVAQALAYLMLWGTVRELRAQALRPTGPPGTTGATSLNYLSSFVPSSEEQKTREDESDVG